MISRWKKKKVKKPIRHKRSDEHVMLIKQVFVGFGLLVSIGVLITALWYGSRIDSLQIIEVSVVGGTTISHFDITELVFSQMEGTYFKLVPKTFTWTYPKKSIKTRILNIPRVKHVEVEKINPQKLTVAFEEYQPYALWCVDTQDDQCVFLDRFGFAFAQAPELTGSVFVRYIEKDTMPTVKEQAFSEEFIRKTNSFSEKLATELDLYVINIEKVEDLDILYTVSGGGILKVSQTMDSDTSFKNLRSILGSEDFIHLQNGKFQYIDLRFGDKIFLNEENKTATVATSSIE